MLLPRYLAVLPTEAAQPAEMETAVRIPQDVVIPQQARQVPPVEAVLPAEVAAPQVREAPLLLPQVPQAPVPQEQALQKQVLLQELEF